MSLGPIVPVCTQGTPCYAPAARTVLVFGRNDRVVRTTTDASGHYRVALSPGIWRVSLTTTSLGGGRIAPEQARVVAGTFRSVDFVIDTGIR